MRLRLSPSTKSADSVVILILNLDRLTMLSDIEKKLVRLRKSGLTYKQIAEQVNMPVQTTRNRIRIAAKKLGDEFMFRKNETLSWRKDGGVR